MKTISKKLPVIALALVILFNTGCGTIFGGHIGACQKTKPAPGEQTRQIRPAALIFDILACGGIVGIIGTIIDFSNGAIYKPCDKPATQPTK